MAETEALLWEETQILVDFNGYQSQATENENQDVSGRTRRWYFTDGFSKNKEIFSRNGWYNTSKGFDGIMGIRNTKSSIYPLHAEFEGFIWTIECIKNLRQFNVTFATN